MASYKVPQDVEADDKLIGPFSFRQFIYLLIVGAAVAIGYFLSKLFIPLAIIPLPVVLFFGALALPLRKDQPMETYLAAIISFYVKPRKRLWNPDGLQTLVEITAPTVMEVQRTKNLSQDEAEQRFSYLASIVDSRGWAVRGVDGQDPYASSTMTSDAYYDAQRAEDMLDESSGVGKDFDTKLDQATAKHHQEMLARVRQPQPAVPAGPPDPYASLQPPTQPQATPNPAVTTTSQPAQQATTPPQQSTSPSPSTAPDDANIHLTMNPYPTAMHQSVVDPSGASQPTPAEPAKTTAQTTSDKSVSPDIMNLANNSDLSVETIAREAQRMQKKHQTSDDEVVISLR